MRVLQVINSLDIGGAEKLLTLIMPEITSYGITVDLLIFGKENETTFLKEFLLNKKINIIHSGYGIYDIRNIIILCRIINQYDLFHVHLFPAQYWTVISKILTKSNTQIITTEHSTYNRRRRFLLFRFIDRFIYRNYYKIISISRHTELSLLRWLNAAKSNKFIVIENGINADEFSRAEAFNKYDISTTSVDRKIVLMVARFSHEKDHNTLINSIPHIKTGVEVWLVGGGDKALKDKSIALTNELCVEDKVKFLGKRKDIPRIIKTADVCILSSKWEGFGLVAVEYMAAGKPVLASAVDGLKQIVEDAGLLFERENYIDLANKIDLVLDDKNIYENLVLKGLERSKKYCVSTTALNYTNVYLESMNE